MWNRGLQPGFSLSAHPLAFPVSPTRAWVQRLFQCLNIKRLPTPTCRSGRPKEGQGWQGLEQELASRRHLQTIKINKFKKVWNTNEDYLRKEVRRCPFSETHQTPVIQLPQLIILAVQYSIPIYIDEILIQAQYVSATELGRCFSQRNYHLKKS